MPSLHMPLLIEPRDTGASTSWPASAAALCSAVRIMSPSNKSGSPFPKFSVKRNRMHFNVEIWPIYYMISSKQDVKIVPASVKLNS